MLKVLIHTWGDHVCIKVKGYNPKRVYEILRKDLKQIKGLLYVGLDVDRGVFSVDVLKEHEETIVSSLYRIADTCNLAGIKLEERSMIC